MALVFFISSSGYIATNNHVIDGASKIEVEFNYKNGIKSFNASVVKVDATNDLAIIKLMTLALLKRQTSRIILVLIELMLVLTFLLWAIQWHCH